MTDAIPATADADDAKLLNLVRAADTAAFSVLFQRHEQAARRLAHELAGSPAELDDLVTETFALLLAITLRGGGPSDSFRPYLLAALRRVHEDRLRYRRNQPPTDDRLLLDPGAPLVDRESAGLAETLIVRSFLALPERWCAVLWHTEIERAIAANVAPVFGLTRNGVATLRRRAKDGLRQAYLQSYAARLTDPDCLAVTERLGAFIGDALPGRETGEVAEHLGTCAGCRTVCAELADVSTALRGSVAPVFLGAAAAAYLSGTDDSVPGAAQTDFLPGAIRPAGRSRPRRHCQHRVAATGRHRGWCRGLGRSRRTEAGRPGALGSAALALADRRRCRCPRRRRGRHGSCRADRSPHPRATARAP